MMSQTKIKDLEYYMSLPYTIELTPDIDGFWFAQIPMLDGCMTNGDSQATALEMIEDAKLAWLTAAIQLKMKIPEPELERL
jgi:antitoxin HicB